MAKKLTKTIADYKTYLDILEKLAKPLSSEQKEQLNTILTSQLSLLIALKQDSGLGRVDVDYLLRDRT